MKSYAVDPSNSKGRFYPIRSTKGRDEFQRDRDRIIHSKAFRRLAHKTQVFVYHEGDHYRNRLTHSLEVAQITRAVARMMEVNEDLAELTALSHDLGHPPFGHAGEYALDEKMKEYGGFDHNAQSLRIVTTLENRYPEHNGINLTRESLEGILKHNGPIIGNIPHAIKEFENYQDLNLNLHAGIEAQIAALCDDIAYNAHDIDDGLRAKIFAIEELEDLDFCANIMKQIRNDYPSIDPYAFKHEFIRRLITYFVQDMFINSQINIKTVNPKTYDDICQAGIILVCFSQKGEAQNKKLKNFLMENMYRHPTVNRMSSKAKRVISDLCDIYMGEPEILPLPINKQVQNSSDTKKALIIMDFISGMTDKFALEEHQKLFDINF